ncbi:hypothetical protein MVEN_02152700 [Mycena venus]|uniref:Uncharacterized protein n=1 Tax=Mycena venus TaxID=2733690 RepID=A0A8H6XAP1_9AGAR|nr:hypothetical protein MVEN_02152700 [Mycena venus]
MRFPAYGGVHSLRTSNTEAMVIDMLTLKGYHDVCSFMLSHPYGVDVSLSMIVNVEAVIFWPEDDVLEHWVEIASLTDAEIDVSSWFNSGTENGEKSVNGWTRFRSEDIIGKNIYLWIQIQGGGPYFWLSQANHIFSRLEITSDLGDYALIGSVEFWLTISASKVDCPSGFLFLCPENYFQIGPSSFAWPDSPAYWSLDSLGVNRLSTEEATRLGFPTIQPETQIRGCHWDDSVYAGLRQFHQAKGFDPDSQDIAKHLEYPLFQLANEVEVPFAHIDDGDSDTVFAEDESQYPQTSPTEPDGGNSSSEAGDQDSSISKNHSQNIKSSVGDNHATHSEFPAHQPIAGESPDEPPVPQDEAPASLTFKWLMNIQLALFLTLALSWLYECI